MIFAPIHQLLLPLSILGAGGIQDPEAIQPRDITITGADDVPGDATFARSGVGNSAFARSGVGNSSICPKGSV